MASYLPPTEELPIFDNQVFDINNSTALTYADAKKYFLTYPIAQGTSTITDLITTSISYLSPLSGSFFNIGTNQVSGGTIRIGPSGGATGVSVHCGNVDFKNNTINNANNASGGDISIGNSQTDGILNIGTGSRTTTGNINIGTGSGATLNKVNIGGAGTVTTFTNGLTLASSKYITTTASASALTAPSHPTQVGCLSTVTNITSTIPTTNNITSLASITLTAGTWVVVAQRQVSSTSGTTRILLSFGDTSRSNVAPVAGDYVYGLTSQQPTSSGNTFVSLSSIINITSTGNTIVYLNIEPTYATTIPATSISNFRFVATRIA